MYSTTNGWLHGNTSQVLVELQLGDINLSHQFRTESEQRPGKQSKTALPQLNFSDSRMPTTDLVATR